MMFRAIELARQTALVDQAGGPFGCVIVKDGAIIAEGANTVLADNDPTCHGEMNAIRNACKELNTHDLSGCTLYTTGEPCPMCYGAIWWSRIEKIYYASTTHDAKEFGKFDDAALNAAVKDEIAKRPIKCEEILRSEMLKLWQEFSNSLHY